MTFKAMLGDRTFTDVDEFREALRESGITDEAIDTMVSLAQDES